MIRFENITRDFAAPSGTVQALRGINLTIPAGEIFGIIGSSGAGKSTLVRIINLLERLDRGDVFLADERITDAKGETLRSVRRRIGMVFQHFNLLNARTVASNVAYPLELASKLDRKAIDAKVAALLKRVGLSAHADKCPRQLSGGQKERVGIARALANDPHVVLCDEATSALDPETTRSVLSLLREINRELGVTVVLITHEMDVIRQTCDRVAVLDHGQLVEEGPALDVFRHPKHEATLRLVREAEHLDGAELPDIGDDSKLLRLTFVGETASTPVLGQAARQSGVDHEVVEGRVGKIRDIRYAQFTVRLIGGDAQLAVEVLKAAGVDIEILSQARELIHVV